MNCFWGEDPAAGGGAAVSGDQGLALAVYGQPQPSASQRTQRSLPGPAGRLAACGARPAASTASFGGGSGGPAFSSGGGGSGSAWAVPDPDFQSRPWLQALQEADTSEFDEHRPPFKDNTVRAAARLQQNAVLDRLLAVVLAVKRCHSGEAFVRLKDPTGAIGGTLTRAALAAEPDIRHGAVLRLRRVTVLRTPPPRSINHLCITLEAIEQVIPPATGPRDGRPAPPLQLPAAAPQHVFPALPAPPQAALQPAASQQQRRALPVPLQPAQQQQAQQQQQQPGSQQGMLQPPARHPAGGTALAPSPTFAWPSISAVPLPAGQRAPVQQQQQLSSSVQQQQARGGPAQQAPAPGSSFAWPSLGAAPAGSMLRPGPRHVLPPQPPASGRPQGQQRQVESMSVNFSMPSFSQQPAWQDDATSGPSGGAAVQQHQHAPQQQQRQGGSAPKGWLAGLLAEADFDPFASSQGSQQPVGAGRLPLTERQPQLAAHQQQAPPGTNAAKRQCILPASSAPRMLPPQQQQQQRSPPAGGAVFADGIDDLDLDD